MPIHRGGRYVQCPARREAGTHSVCECHDCRLGHTQSRRALRVPVVSLADEGIGERMQSARLICTSALVEVAWILVQKRSELRRQS